MLPQLRLDGSDAGRSDALNLGVLPEEPESEIDVVNRAVDEDPTRELSIGDEEAGGVEHVACLGAEDGGAPD